jgi:hypothetical protein
MNRTFWLLLPLALTSSSCNAPTCGPGTKQVQDKNGNLQCIPTEDTPSSVGCDYSAGVMLVAGQCVPRKIPCGPGTKYDPVKDACVPDSSGPMGLQCSQAPDPSRICVVGKLFNFVDDKEASDNGPMVTVSLYDPLAYIKNNGTAGLIAPPITTSHTYVFDNVAINPGQMFVAVVVDSENKMGIQAAAAIAIVPGNQYRVDGYIANKALVDGWASQGFDASGGAYVLKFYHDLLQPAPRLNSIIGNETMPAAGVTAADLSSMLPSPPMYFGADLATIDKNATATTLPTGAAVIPMAPAGDDYSGMGGGVAMWEHEQGGAVANVLFVQRFHACPAGGCTY